MFPARAAPVLFGFILTCLMTFIVSGVATYRAVGMTEVFAGLWMTSWIASWIVAFPVVLVVGPLTRKMVAKLVRPA